MKSLYRRRKQAGGGPEEDAIRGITARTPDIWSLFRDFARGDFKHDFGEREPTRDLVMDADVNRFLEIAKQFSKKGKVALSADFQNTYVGTTLYQIIDQRIDEILPLPGGAIEKDQTFYDERTLLGKLGIDYDAIKNEMTNVPEGGAIQREFVIPTLGPRSYTIRSASYRLGKKGEPGYSKNQNVTTIFNKVTGGRTKFVLIVDASGGLPLSDLLNSELEPPPTEPNEFYIVENIENESDSATKLSKLKQRGAGTVPDVFFLRETGNTIVYPLWDNVSDPKSNIYSSAKIILNRIQVGEVEANLILTNPDGSEGLSVNIGDVSNSSNVKNATLRAIASVVGTGNVEEALAYTLAKRMGDWCQALSMLDLDRSYNILDVNRNPTGVLTTLRERMVDSEIGVVTNDRILLGVCIFLGLNVFFTSAMDVARVIYFKNNNDIPEGPALAARTDEIYQSVLHPPPEAVEALASEQVANIVGSIGPLAQDIIAEPDLPMYIYKLKCLASNIGKIKNEFAVYAEQIAKNEGVYASPPSPLDKFNAANALVSLLTKVDNDIAYNAKVFTDIAEGKYENSARDGIRIQALIAKLPAGRISKSAEVAEAKEILASVRDDFKQIIGKNIPEVTGQLGTLLRDGFEGPERAQSTYAEILSPIALIKSVLPGQVGGGQKGGGPAIDYVWTSLRTIEINLVESEDVKLNDPSISYVQGSQYIDEKLNRYTVSDEFIVTKGESNIFDVFFTNEEVEAEFGEETDDTKSKVKYICLKYLLLQHDILRNRYDNIYGEIGGVNSISREREAQSAAQAAGEAEVARLEAIAPPSNEILAEAFARKMGQLAFAEIMAKRLKTPDPATLGVWIENYATAVGNAAANVVNPEYAQQAYGAAYAIAMSVANDGKTQAWAERDVAEIGGFTPEQADAYEQDITGRIMMTRTQEKAVELLGEDDRRYDLAYNVYIYDSAASVAMQVYAGYYGEEGGNGTLEPGTVEYDSMEDIRENINRMMAFAYDDMSDLVKGCHAFHQKTLTEYENKVVDFSLILDALEAIQAEVLSNFHSDEPASTGPAAAGSGAPPRYGPPEGGLRTRRPLYSNARPTPSHHVDGASKHEGLRKRTGARTHRRLRKSSRLTRRR
jgi:hypothetical protein